MDYTQQIKRNNENWSQKQKGKDILFPQAEYIMPILSQPYFIKMTYFGLKDKTVSMANKAL